MEDNQNIPQAPDFSDIPSLGDTSGLLLYDRTVRSIEI